MDGTLTDARKPVDAEFATFLKEFCGRQQCHVVTGSDYGKVHEQLGEDLCNAFKTIYACNGNVAYAKNRVVWWSEAKSWALTKQQVKVLRAEVDCSEFGIRAGDHIEQRMGCANFSIVGRGADMEQRALYRAWDSTHGERQTVVDRLRSNKLFDDLEMVLGGETGIDIYPRGFSKAQVRSQLKGRVLFFGDRCEPGGNDYEIAMACDQFHHVRNWRETFALLMQLQQG